MRRVLGAIVRSTIGIGVLAAVTTAQAAAQQAFVTLNGDPKKEAWWVIAEFHPFTTEVRGIPANQIRKSWCKATEFRKDLIPRELLFDGNTDAMAAVNMSFAIEGHFDGTTTKQVALVGVFQECAGAKGRFVLIIDQPAGGKPKIRFVSAVRTDRQFGALQKGKDGALVTSACMECDEGSVLKWDRKKRQFDWVPQGDEL
ncbi:hypothetical protein QY049_33220 [Bradyrhizobium sp. WYCCWR 13022]|uniref:hypothetical protein n=1 Tax=unclassified Bradyrhizobium TaxID=2631580 RepID=UPI00263A999F|nr:hypothetical protein [Bradyrhizobium sp. WYCCWR 13022]MDN4988032.1 hypothetical protein [Bradyrhizobium sp. WYCCWR 13022]